MLNKDARPTSNYFQPIRLLDPGCWYKFKYLTASTSDDTNSNTWQQTVQIQISWLLQKPTDLDLHCLQRKGISGFSRTRVKGNNFVLELFNYLFMEGLFIKDGICSFWEQSLSFQSICSFWEQILSFKSSPNFERIEVLGNQITVWKNWLSLWQVPRCIPSS